MRIALLLGILSVASAGGADDQRTHTIVVQGSGTTLQPLTRLHGDHSQPRSPSIRLPAAGQAKDPFARLFPQIVTPGLKAQAPQPAERTRHAPERVVCGMRLIPTDPNLDRGMVHTPERRSGVEFAIRRVHPTTCLDPKRP
jgi:hypothetical protein